MFALQPIIFFLLFVLLLLLATLAFGMLFMVWPSPFNDKYGSIEYACMYACFMSMMNYGNNGIPPLFKMRSYVEL